jgi:zinc transport system permease protein
MALIAEGVAHAGFGGLGVAILLGQVFSFAVDSLWGKLIIGVFCVATALGIRFITRSRKVHDDSAIGIFLVASIALGLALIKIAAAFGPVRISPEAALFGEMAAATWLSAIVVSSCAVVTILVIWLFYHQFLYVTLDEEMARVNGVATGLVNTLQLILVSLIVVVGARVVGALMITALMIIPGATGAMLSRRFGGVMAGSLLTGVGGTALALTLNFNTKLNIFQPGPVIVLTLFVIFAGVWIFRHAFKPKVVALEAESPGDSHAGHSH